MRLSRSRLLLAVLVVTLCTGALLATSALRSGAELPGIARDPAPGVEGLTFLDHADPTSVRETDLVPDPGELLFLYFGYLSCPDVCPLTMADIGRAQAEVGPELAARTAVAFVTLDPARDDGERLRSYLAHFLDGTYLALRAQDEESLTHATERLGVRWEVEPHSPGAQRYEVAHSAITYVIDDTGTVVRELPFGATPEDYAALMRALLP